MVEALELLDLHYESFFSIAKVAEETGHPVPMDTRGWSQILCSVLTGIRGVDRKKGADLVDGSDVKGANTWMAIDTPRFNGVIKAGTQATTSGRLESLDSMPHLYFVLWDVSPRGNHRCRVWVVRPDSDINFRGMALLWYKAREAGTIKSDNFQLHPPRGLDSDEIRNTCGNLIYPLYFSAEIEPGIGYVLQTFDEDARTSGVCVTSSS